MSEKQYRISEDRPVVSMKRMPEATEGGRGTFTLDSTPEAEQNMLRKAVYAARGVAKLVFFDKDFRRIGHVEDDKPGQYVHIKDGRIQDPGYAAGLDFKVIVEVAE